MLGVDEEYGSEPDAGVGEEEEDIGGEDVRDIAVQAIELVEGYGIPGLGDTDGYGYHQDLLAGSTAGSLKEHKLCRYLCKQC
ncbi:hypothetical protein [Mastigocoleus testarum]|uniref:Uncharacterized protein n=1 Tax=Mastigocoleus testarum BC008 TaxID=371196 RepID=A0A0V8A101_9CYAN|nr:hypothetical protein [Mastigocoleus testarum]KST70303.1 hypothetical protein BC008_44680 [Mastigocoleus testarum BC008]